MFTLALALERVGAKLWEKVGREPSGSAFNSIVQLESERGIPRNPLINPGAMVVTDHLIGDRDADAAIDDLLAFLRAQARDDGVTVDEAVAASESETGAAQPRLAWFMKSFGVLSNDVETVLGAYFRQCAVAMSCRQLARAGLFLAFDGRDPESGAEVTAWHRARRINSVMMLCGHYDNSGEFAFRVGLPGKSGVGGGILAIAPGPRRDRGLVARASTTPAPAPSAPRAGGPGRSAPAGRCSVLKAILSASVVSSPQASLSSIRAARSSNAACADHRMAAARSAMGAPKGPPAASNNAAAGKE